VAGGETVDGDALAVDLEGVAGGEREGCEIGGAGEPGGAVDEGDDVGVGGFAADGGLDGGEVGLQVGRRGGGVGRHRDGSGGRLGTAVEDCGGGQFSRQMTFPPGSGVRGEGRSARRRRLRATGAENPTHLSGCAVVLQLITASLAPQAIDRATVPVVVRSHWLWGLRRSPDRREWLWSGTLDRDWFRSNQSRSSKLLKKSAIHAFRPIGLKRSRSIASSRGARDLKANRCRSLRRAKTRVRDRGVATEGQ